MAETCKLRVRYSIRHLQEEYDNGNKKPVEDLIRAWRAVKALPPSDKRSFFVLGGYHGEPFQYRRAVDALSETDQYVYWGGYCNHGNVLFPTWHRIYCYKLEEALRTFVPDVTLPYWDETSEETLAKGIPSLLTQLQFELDGELIDNPLRSFVLPVALSDALPGDSRIYEKPAGYETVRYPLSGLVGTAEAREQTALHNAKYPNLSENTRVLNDNVVAWLEGGGPTDRNPSPSGHGAYWEYGNCLQAPNYTVFSNASSASQWNLDHHGVVTSLESPHNHIHLAVGGFDIPEQGESGQTAGANGDMGENNTAAMDPIFFFHHCNVDRMFWLWQKAKGQTDTIDIMPGYAGTSSSDSQGPTPGVPPGTPLSLDTPLTPFVKDQFGTMYTSRDCVNIETQLGYTYQEGSLSSAPAPVRSATGSPRKLTVRGIDRALFEGSFVIRAFGKVRQEDGTTKVYNLGAESVLSRRNIVRCANCLTHLEVIAHFPLDQIPAADVDRVEFWIEIQHRGPALPAKLKYELEVRD